MFVLSEKIKFTEPRLRMIEIENNSKRLKDSTFRNVFINRNLSYNQRIELFRLREEARRLDTHSGNLTATPLNS